jgi:hypothetical protein
MNTSNTQETEINKKLQHVYILKTENVNEYRVIGKESNQSISQPSDFKTALKEADRLDAEISIQRLSVQKQSKPTINPHSYDFYFRLIYEQEFNSIINSGSLKSDSDAYDIIDCKVRRILKLKDQ